MKFDIFDTKARNNAARQATELLAPRINGVRTKIVVNVDGSVTFKPIKRKRYSQAVRLLVGL